MSKRYEFPASVKKAARMRSGGVCEAVGPIYGLPPETRCTRLLAVAGVEFDHSYLPAHAENSATLENCMAVCPICHRVKSNTWDIPAEAKIKRRKRANGPIEDRRKTQRIPQPAHHKWPKRAFQSRKTK